MKDRSILERNLLALSARNPAQSIKVSRAEEKQDIGFQFSKTGKIIPYYKKNDRAFFLHSLMDPEREAQGIFDTHARGGYVVFLGLGGGYHIFPFLKETSINKILIIDTDISFFKSVLSRIDLYDLILDRRVDFLIDPKPEEIKEFLLASYVPALTGNLTTVPLRARMQSDNLFFESIISSIKDTIGLLADDYTVQVHFGKKWFKNSLVNLETAEKAITTLKPIRRALITGAGPSLEEQLPFLRKVRSTGTLIATDTSFAFLIRNDIIPDIIISIDCQHITYHHFLQGYPKEIPLVLDLASPPALTRLTDKCVFFSSGHPFSQYINRNWRRFPFIDISGGNVSHAAVSLADTLGAQECYLFGADFSYPRGKSYSRGTYLYPYFLSRTSRENPLEDCFYGFLMRNINILKERRDYGWLYTTRPMISYKERLEEAAKRLFVRVIPVEGSGVPLTFPEQGKKRETGIRSVFSAGLPLCEWRDFMQTYSERLAALPPPIEPLTEYLSALPAAQQDLWKTVYPVAAVLRKARDKSLEKGSSLLTLAQQWTVNTVREYLYTV